MGNCGCGGAANGDDEIHQLQGKDHAVKSYCFDPIVDAPWANAIAIPSDDASDEMTTTQDTSYPNHRQVKLPVMIQQGLYLGNSSSVQDLQRLKTLNIRRVLNVAGPLALPSSTIRAYRKAGIVYKRITAKDEEGYPMLERHWEESFQFIQEARRCNQNCVVHCVAGLNRSVLIVAASHLIESKESVCHIVDHMRRCRGYHALNNRSFQEQLVAFSRTEGLLGSMPVV